MKITRRTTAPPNLWWQRCGILIAFVFVWKIPAAFAQDNSFVQLHDGSKESASAVEIIPGTDQLLVGHVGGTVAIWSLTKRQQLGVWEFHTQAITKIAVAPDGKQAAITSADASITVVDTASGTALRRLTMSGSALSISFSPDGSKLLASSNVGELILWDSSRGKRIKSFDGIDCSIYSAAFVHDGKQMLVASEHDPVSLWDMDSAEVVRTFGDPYVYTAVEVAPDGQAFLATGSDRVTLWETKTGRRIHDIDIEGSLGIPARFHPDGSAAIVFDQKSGGRLLDLESFKPRIQFPLSGMQSVAIDPIHKMLAVGKENGSVFLLRLQTKN